MSKRCCIRLCPIVNRHIAMLILGYVRGCSQKFCNKYRVRHKSVNTPVRHTSVNTPVRHKSVNTPVRHTSVNTPFIPRTTCRTHLARSIYWLGVKLYEMRDMGATAAILKAANKPFVG